LGNLDANLKIWVNISTGSHGIASTFHDGKEILEWHVSLSDGTVIAIEI
jgi:hypothetical protein